MKVRPSIKHYCDNHGHMDGRLTETKTPVFHIGCCFDLQWEGTREQAAELYDYLMQEGYLTHRDVCAEGCYDMSGDDMYQYTVWVCGECGSEYEVDDYEDAKSVAISCCAPDPEDEPEDLNDDKPKYYMVEAA